MTSRRYPFASVATIIFTLGALFSHPALAQPASTSTATLCAKSSTGDVRYNPGANCMSGERKLDVAKGPIKGYASTAGSVPLLENNPSAEVAVVSTRLPAGNYLATFTTNIATDSVTVPTIAMCRMWVGDDVVVNASTINVAPGIRTNFALTGGFTLLQAGTLVVRCYGSNYGSAAPGPMLIVTPSLTVLEVGKLTTSAK